MDKKGKMENGIQMYFHCKDCLNNGRKDKIAVGWTVKGVQVWCETCDTNVVALDFKGLKVGYDENPKEKLNKDVN